MEAKEDYLRIIHELQKSKQKAKVTEIAQLLNINKASVSEMIKKLAKQKLLTAKPYSSISLTEKGRKEARKITEKHETIERFAKNLLKHTDEKAHEEAHKLEHAFSPESINKLDKFMDELHKTPEKLPSYIG